MGTFSSLGGGRSGTAGSASVDRSSAGAVPVSVYGSNNSEKRGLKALAARGGYVYREREINLDKTLPRTPTRSMSDDSSSIGEEMAIVRVPYDGSGKRI
jgi:hypothetical protein